MNTAERIKKIFEDSNLSYIELEHLTGVSRSSLQRYANGITEKIPLEVIEVISEKFNVSPAYLMGWNTVSDEDKDGFVLIDAKNNDSITLRYEESNFSSKPNKELTKSIYRTVFEKPAVKELVGISKNMSDEQLQEVIDYAKYIVDK